MEKSKGIVINPDCCDKKKDKDTIVIKNTINCCSCQKCPTGNGSDGDCPASGELLRNGGMEDFTGSVPAFWTANSPSLVSQETAQGRVHSGNSSVRLENGAVLSQVVTGITGGCFYEFSFHANGEGAQVGVTVSLVFMTPGGEVQVGAIMVRRQDIPTAQREFNYYRKIVQAPAGATSVRYEISVDAQGEQALLLDDASLAVQ